VDDESAERRLVSDPLDGPAFCAGCDLEGIPGCRNAGGADAREEVEVLCGPARQVLRDQGRATGEEEALSCRQGEEELSDLDLEVGQGQWLLPIGDGGHWGACWTAESTTSDQAARGSRGRTRLFHRSTSSQEHPCLTVAVRQGSFTDRSPRRGSVVNVGVSGLVVAQHPRGEQSRTRCPIRHGPCAGSALYQLRAVGLGPCERRLRGPPPLVLGACMPTGDSVSAQMNRHLLFPTSRLESRPGTSCLQTRG